MPTHVSLNPKVVCFDAVRQAEVVFFRFAEALEPLFQALDIAWVLKGSKNSRCMGRSLADRCRMFAPPVEQPESSRVVSTMRARRGPGARAVPAPAHGAAAPAAKRPRPQVTPIPASAAAALVALVALDSHMHS